MFSSLKNLFQQNKITLEIEDQDLYLLCGLMIESANIDGKIDQQEVNKISSVLVNIFCEDPVLVEIELKRCLDDLNNLKSLQFFTSKINKSFSYEKKILLLEALWEIILEDGELHDYESNLIRRLGGLLYISNIDLGNIKKNILSKKNKQL